MLHLMLGWRVRSDIHHAEAYRWSHQIDGVDERRRHCLCLTQCCRDFAKRFRQQLSKVLQWKPEVTSHSCGWIRNSSRAASLVANRSRLFG